MARKAVTAVYGAVRFGFKRNAGFFSALGAGGDEKFARSAGAVLAVVAAGFAALRLILESAFCVEFLFTGGEYEFLSALFTYEGFVFEHGLGVSLKKYYSPRAFLTRECIMNTFCSRASMQIRL